MKRVAVFFDDPHFDGYPFDDATFRRNYHDIAALMEEKGGQLCVVRAQHTYAGGMTFRGGWCYEHGTFARTDEEVTADVIWNKEHFRGDAGMAILNDPELEAICNDKWRTYELFPDMSPQTRFVPAADMMRKALDEWESPTVVCKPYNGERGVDVYIGQPSNMPVDNMSFPAILQAFIDTSGGIPGIVDGHHDFRLISIRGEIGSAYVRTPPTGSLVANVAQGGREIPVALDAIPEGARAVFTAVDAALARFPRRIYSIDLGRDSDGSWKIIELNAKPGPPEPSASDEYRRFLSLLVDTLLS